MSEFKSAVDSQHGGTHYKEKGIQPIEYAHANDLSFFQGNVVKYVTRYKDKKGSEDLKKAIHYLQMILEFEYDVLTNFSYSDENIEEVTEFQTEEDFFSHGKEIAKELYAKDISQEELKEYTKNLLQEQVSNPAVRDYLKTVNVSLVNDVIQVTPKLWYPPVEDGGNPWIEYDGNGQPVMDSQLTEVWFSDGSNDTGPAHFWL